MRARNLVLGPALAAGLLIAYAVPAFAATSTTGTLAGGVTGTASASSSCPPGAVVTGLNVDQEFSRDFVSAVSVTCTGADGTVTTGSPIGDNPGATSTVSCAGTDVALGFYGDAGDIVDGVGIRCGSVGGTATNGGLVWDGGGNPQGPFDCPAGSALTGLTGTFVYYYGADDVASLTGVCTAIIPTSKNQCKDGGWTNFDTTVAFKNQGDCVSFVATGGRNPPSGP